MKDDHERDGRGLGGRRAARQQVPGMTRKNFWIPNEICEALRTRAFYRRCTESDIVREVLEAALLADGADRES